MNRNRTQQHLADHFRQIHFGGNWTSVNLQEELKDTSWEQATQKVASFHSIAELTFHIHYFARAAMQVLEGDGLNAHDKYSFDVPTIQSQAEWLELQKSTWECATRFAELIESLPEDQLWEPFAEEKYGNYYRNIQGIIEHSHYHLGQIVMIKKLIPIP